MPVKNILITGRPGVGKTTAIKKVLSALDIRPRGFYTEEIRDGRERRGFTVKTFGGRDCVLAHTDIQGVPRVGRYGVDVVSFENTALPELEEAVGKREIIVIDEIGKMEMFSNRFKNLVLQALDGPAPVLAVISESGNGFINGIKKRKDVKLFTLSRQARDALIPDIATSLDALTRGSL
ncbi:MAG: NTPase [Planctomycetes bacterium]|nr:NTPase [Planctomycetota bacterium]